MPHVPVHPSAIKRHRQSLKRHARNRSVKTQVHSSVKHVTEALAGDPAAAEAALRSAMKALGKAASKGVIHRNTASRKIARLSARLHRAKAKSATT
jgi:small subunit ribosomal protein S20